MQERPVIIERNNSGNTAIVAIVAVIIAVAAGLFYFQPWNGDRTAPANNTTVVNQQPAGPSQDAASKTNPSTSSDTSKSASLPSGTSSNTSSSDSSSKTSSGSSAGQ